MQPKISVFIPYYNDKKYLSQSIDSVLAQSFTEFELILLDHASTDGSREIAESYDDRRIKHLHMKKNLGAGGGILFIEFLKAASGKYVKPFCADDVMEIDCLGSLYTFMENKPGFDAVFADMEFVDENLISQRETWFQTRRQITETEIAFSYLHCGGSILPYPASMLKRSVLRDSNFDKVCIQIADHFLWTSMILGGSKFGYLSRCLVKYRVHPEQMSSIANENIDRRSIFENTVFPSIFLRSKNVSFFKSLLRESRFAEKLDADDEGLLPFVVAEHCANSAHPSTRVWGLTKLYELLSDDNTRNRIEAKFDYGIRDFRITYSSAELLPSLEGVGFKTFIKMGLRKLKRAMVRMIGKAKKGVA